MKVSFFVCLFCLYNVLIYIVYLFCNGQHAFLVNVVFIMLPL